MTVGDSSLRFFALTGSESLGSAVAGCLGIELFRCEERDFEDGEHKSRPLVGVRGADVYVLLSLAGGSGASVNDRLCRLLFFIAACRENGAASVTAIAPYLAYSRKDRQTKARDPVTTRYVAQLFEAMGTSRIVTLDVHNLSAFQNAFRCESIHLDTRCLFIPAIGELTAGLPVSIVSPDTGGVKRAQLLKETLEAQTGAAAGFAFCEKRRSRGIVTGDLFAGDVNGAAAVIVDDMIGSGGTVLRAARACRQRGAKAVFAFAAHGLFGSGAQALFEDGSVDQVVVTDSVEAATSFKTDHNLNRLRIITAAPLIAEAVKRLHAGGSISELLKVET